MAAFKGQDLLEATISDLTDQLVDKLELGWLKITNRFETRRDGPDARQIAEAVTDWEYRQVSIVWSVPVALSHTDEELRATLIHELVHALNAPVWNELSASQQDKLSKLNELSTENMTRALLAALSA
jgi:hypothetical protein